MSRRGHGGRTNWMEHYASLDNAQSSDDEHEPQEDQEFVYRTPRHRISVEEQQRRMNELIAHNKLMEARSNTITKINPSSTIDENETSLQTILYKVISTATSSLSREEILEQLKVAGWQSSSKYHAYSSLDKELRKGYFLYNNVDRKFSLRKGFGYKSEAITKAPRDTIRYPHVAKLSDLIKYIVKEYFPDDRTITDVHFAMTSFGLKCSYSSVRRALLSMQA